MFVSSEDRDYQILIGHGSGYILIFREDKRVVHAMAETQARWGRKTLILQCSNKITTLAYLAIKSEPIYSSLELAILDLEKRGLRDIRLDCLAKYMKFTISNLYQPRPRGAPTLQDLQFHSSYYHLNNKWFLICFLVSRKTPTYVYVDVSPSMRLCWLWWLLSLENSRDRRKNKENWLSILPTDITFMIMKMIMIDACNEF